MIFDDSEESFIHVEQEFTQVGIQKLRHLHLKYATHVGIVHPLTYIDFKVIRQVLGLLHIENRYHKIEHITNSSDVFTNLFDEFFSV